MKKFIKIVFFFLLFMVALFGLLFLYFQSSNDPRGVVDVKTSPNNQVIAYGYEDSGGGAAGYCNFSISVLRLGGKISLFSFHSGHAEVFETESCEQGFKFDWLSGEELELQVYCPNSEYEYRSKKLNEFKGIKISYNNC